MNQPSNTDAAQYTTLTGGGNRKLRFVHLSKTPAKAAVAGRPPYRSRQDGGSPYGRDKRGRSRVRCARTYHNL